MAADLEALERRVRVLEDREAISALVAAYGTLADCGDAEAVAALWHEDGAYEVVGFATARGHAEIAGLINGETHRALMAAGCGHMLGPIAIDLDGDRATARGHSVVTRHTPTGFEIYRVSANRWTFERRDGVWRALHRANAMLDGAEAARILLTPPAARHPS